VGDYVGLYKEITLTIDTDVCVHNSGSPLIRNPQAHGGLGGELIGVVIGALCEFSLLNWATPSTRPGFQQAIADMSTTNACGAAPPAAGEGVLALGGRFLAVNPCAAGGDPDDEIALRLEYPASPMCLSRYIDVDGHLVCKPVFQPRRDWKTVFLHGEHIAPEQTYEIWADFAGGAPSAHLGTATTWLWGDLDNTGLVDVSDLLCALDAFSGMFTCSFFASELAPECVHPSEIVDIGEILAVLDAYTGASYPCPSPCPGLCVSP
jgi:hypothetical protein